ncbi:hypothetical protein [Leptospira borgpetersenii]|nr:hypothetical protein [Leptospira borgpetersenii]
MRKKIYCSGWGAISEPDMSVDDPFLHEELLKRFRSYFFDRFCSLNIPETY